MHALAAEGHQNPELLAAARAFWEVRFALLEAMVARGIKRGELPAGTDPTPIVEGLLGAI